MDDVAITRPDATVPVPADFSISSGQSVVNLLQGTSVDIPVSVNRLNGSNGDVTFSVGQLPSGVTASFNPNPVGGTDTSTTLTLTAGPNADPFDTYVDVTITATPANDGVGPGPRSITKQLQVRRNCTQTIRADYIDARTTDCFRVGAPGIYTSEGPIALNGLVVTPQHASPVLVIDTNTKRIQSRTGGIFTVAPASRAALILYVGTIDWRLSGPGTDPKTIIDHDAGGVRLLGMRMQKVEVALTRSGGSRIDPTLKLDFWPFNYFGALTAKARFTSDNDKGTDFTSLEIKLNKVSALGLELKDVSVKWREGDSWSGGATLTLPFAAQYSVGAGFGLKEGEFDFLRGSVGGLNVLVSPGVFLQSIGFEVQRSPLTVQGRAGFSAGPSVAGKKAVTVNGGFKAVLDDPFVIELNGSAKLGDKFEVGEAFLRYSSNGLFELGGKVEADLVVAYASGEISGFVDDGRRREPRGLRARMHPDLRP